MSINPWKILEISLFQIYLTLVKILINLGEIYGLFMLQNPIIYTDQYWWYFWIIGVTNFPILCHNFQQFKPPLMLNLLIMLFNFGLIQTEGILPIIYEAFFQKTTCGSSNWLLTSYFTFSRFSAVLDHFTQGIAKVKALKTLK